MQLRNIDITGGQIVISAALLFVGITVIFNTLTMRRLTVTEKIAPAASSPSIKRTSVPQEVPVGNAQRVRKVQDLTTIEVDNMKELTPDQLKEIKYLQSLNFTTQTIWNRKNEELHVVEGELNRRLDVRQRQQDAIDNPTEGQDPEKLRRGMYTVNQGVVAQEELVRDLQSELADLQRTLNERTHRINRVIGR